MPWIEVQDDLQGANKRVRARQRACGAGATFPALCSSAVCPHGGALAARPPQAPDSPGAALKKERAKERRAGPAASPGAGACDLRVPPPRRRLFSQRKCNAAPSSSPRWRLRKEREMKAAQEATLSKVLGADGGRKRGRGAAADGGEEKIALRKKEARGHAPSRRETLSLAGAVCAPEMSCA